MALQRLKRQPFANGGLDADVEPALHDNEAIAAALAQQGVGDGEVLGVSTADGSVTVYIADDDNDNGDEDSSTIGTSTP